MPSLFPAKLLMNFFRRIVISTCLVCMSLFVIIFRLKQELKGPCNFDVILKATTKYVQGNGMDSLTEYLPEFCNKRDLVENNKPLDVFNRAVRDLVYQCHSEDLSFKRLRHRLDKPIVTLFTSWVTNGDKALVHINTLSNWSRFIPNFNIVVFTNDSSVVDLAESYGWTTFPILKHAANGAPVLKTMFDTVMSRFNSTFYGFANSDILFTDSLITTLQAIANIMDKQTPVFMSGIRTNIPSVTIKEATSFNNIQKAAENRGKLFSHQSADYFITTRTFPWHSIPELVIGRPAYDNWIVFHARNIKVNVIDVTHTVLAAHQTTKAGDMEGHSHKDSNYNDLLLNSLNLKPNYMAGCVTCAEWKSFTTICGNNVIRIEKRSSLPLYCKLKS